MTDETHIDYETFSEANLRVVGIWAYARHPSTRIRCVSWARGNAEPSVWRPGQPVPEDLQRAFKRDDLFAFGAPFEIAITECVAVKLGFHVPRREQWNDVMAMARMCSLPPALDRLAQALKVKHQKDKDGKRLIDIFSKPQPRTGIVIRPKDRPEDFKKFMAYCKQDVRSERACHQALPIQRLPPYEQKVWQLDIVINERGVKIDRAMAEGARRLVTVAKAQGGAKLSKATKGVITSAGQGKRIKAMAKILKYPLINLKKETVAAVMGDDALPKLLRTVLELREETNITSVAKFAAMLRTADGSDDRVRDAHAYHSATTGRWGGRIVQTQNLPRPLLDIGPWEHDRIRAGDAESLCLVHGDGLLLLLRDAIRNAIIADKEYEFLVADKASIEARVLGWAAGCKGYQKAFMEKLDLYVVCASGIFGVAYDEILDGYNRGVHKYVEMRKTGKDSVLALGYGQGDGTEPGSKGGFLAYCLRKGGKMTPELSKKTVKAYRKKLFPEVAAFWYETEECAIRCTRTGKPQRMGGKDGRPLIIFEMIKKYLTIKLPSGRRLWYPGAHIKMVTTKWGTIKEQLRFYTEVNSKWWRVGWTYGGSLVENIVQAIARDLLARALLKCEKAMLRPVMHVHDEIVCEVKKKFRRVIDEMHAIFRSIPKWGRGLLLGSGGFVTPYYRK